MIRKIPLSDHYYKESEIDAFLDEKSDKTHGHGDINKDGQITANASSVNKIAVTDSSNSIKTVDVLPLNKVTHQDISGKVNTSDIENNLTSNYTNRPLSAAQGKELKRLVDLKADSDTVYTKSQTMTVSEINQAIANGVGNIEIFEVVQELPTTNIKGNKFYLTPNGENIEKNVYDINIYVNNNWETIDSLEFDISNYPTTSEVTILLNEKVDIIEGKELSSNDFTDALKSKLENDVLTEHQSLTNYIQKSQTSGLVKNDGTIDTNNYLTEHQSLTNYIQKSQTSGLVKNDGTIDTNNYLTQHQSLTNYVQKSQTSGLIKNDGTVDTNNYLKKEEAPKLPNYGFIDSNLILHLIYIGTEISATKTIMQSGDNNPITVIVSDEEGNPLEDVPVEFYINGIKVGQTTNTNSNGVASYTYQGSGSGEIEVQVKIGSFVSETLSVWDTIWYDLEEHTEGASWSTSIGENAFAVEFDVLLTANNSQVWWRVGTDANNCYVIGVIYGADQGIRVRKNGSYTDYVFTQSRVPLNTKTTLKFTYNNGVMTFTDDNETVTLTNNEITPSTLQGLTVSQGGEISNFKIYKL